MIDSIFEFLYVVTTLLAIGVLLRRLGVVEKELRHMRGPNKPRTAPGHSRPHVQAHAQPGVEVLDLMVSPLSIILAQCELAKGDGELDERIELIERQARRMSKLIHREQDTTDRVRWESQQLEPGACVRAAVTHHSGLALERGVKVHVLVDETPTVKASPFLLPHALRHLVRAAIESASPNKGDVTVAVGLFPLEGEPTHLGFAVYDDGPGLDPVKLAQIFEPTPAEGGVEPTPEELSYSIVSAVAQAMDAQFLIESAPNAGTSATLKIPLVPAKTQTGDTDEAPAQKSETKAQAQPVFIPVES